jgi:hypothetical protein
MKSLSQVCTQTVQQISAAARADWSQPIEATVRSLAALAVVTYVLGESLGRWLHETSAVLGQLHSCLLVGHQKAQTVAAPVVEAVAAAIDLSGLTVIELRRVARQQGIKEVGNRRIAQAKRADLLLALA